MKSILLVFALTFISSVVLAEDAVDRLSSKYEVMIGDGLIKLHKRHITELEAVKNSAMTKKDLPLATAAADKITALQIKITKLEAARKNLEDGKVAYPANRFYKMTHSSLKLGSEKGHEIICKFTRLPLNAFSGQKLVLTLTANNIKYADTPNKIFLLKGSGGEEIGEVTGLGRGKSKKIYLTMPPVETLEVAIVVRGGDAVHLKPFAGLVPDVYLSIEK